MTERDDHPDESREHAGLGERTHDFVEEIREEIAEHVPQPVRWTVGKLVKVILLGLGALIVVLIITALLYAANRTQWVAKELALVLNQTLSLRSDVVVSIGDLKGNPFHVVTMEHPEVRFREGDGTPLLEAPSLTVRYSPWNLLTGRRGVDVTLDHPVIRILTDAHGKTRLPVWRSGKASSAVTTYDIGLHLHGGTVILPDEQRVTGVDLDASAHTGRPTQVEIRKLSWADAPRVGRLEQLSGWLAADDSVRFGIDELRMPDVRLSARGGWEASPGNEVKARRMSLKIDRVRWRWLAKAFVNDAFDADGEGAASVDLVREADGRFHGEFLAQADWKGLTGDGSGEFEWAGDRLTIAPADVVSPGGRLSGRFEMRGKAWTLEGDVTEGDPSRWGPIGLTGWPEGNLAGRFRYDTAPDRTAKIVAALGASEIAGWRADSAYVGVKSWPDAPDSFTVDFKRRGGQATLVAEAGTGGWSGDWTAHRFPLEEWPDGRATGLTGLLDRGAGRVAGDDGGLHVTGAIEGPRARWMGADGAFWRVDSIAGRLLPTPDLTTAVQLRDVTFLGVHFDSARAAVRLGDQEMTLDRLRAFAGDTLLDMDARATWDGDRWTFDATRAVASSDQFEFHADPPLRLSGDPRGVTFERLRATDEEARLDITGRWAGPGGSYSFDLTGTSLALDGLGLPREWNLAGRTDAHFMVTGASGDPRWRFEARASGVGVRGAVADSVVLRLSGAPHVLEVEEALAVARDGRASGTLSFDGIRAAWPDTTTPEAVTAWLADAAGWRGRVDADRFPIDGWEGLGAALGRAHGRASGHVVIGGRPDRPALDASIHAAGFAVDDFGVDEIDVEAKYRDGRLEVPSGRATRGAVVSSISGHVALDLALGREPSFPEQPMQWRVDVPNGDLSILPLLVPQIAWARGDFKLETRVEGTPKSPSLDGTLAVRNGQVRMATREELLHDLAADLHFNASRITLDTLVAYQGKSGVVRGSGVAQLDGFKVAHYRFHAGLSEFTAIESGLYSATFDGRFTIVDGVMVHGDRLPHVTGDMEIIQAAVLLDFANESEMRQFTASEAPLYWTYRVHMRATDKLRWVPPNANVEFSADLVLEQSADSLSIFGDVDALRGQYWFLSNRFDVTRANLTFDNVGGIDPQLDIEAQTVLTPTSNEGIAASVDPNDPNPHPARQTITVTITGRSRNPVIDFMSSPNDLGQPVILKELTVQRFSGDNLAAGDPLDDFVTRAINRQLSAEMSKLFQGYVNEWTLTRENGGLIRGEGELYAEVGIPLSAQLQIRYRQRVPGLERQRIGTYSVNPFERDLEVEYRLNRFFYVTSELAQRRTGTGSAATTQGTPEFNVNLKARWEY